jgi:pyruvate dehydrogenase E2 component (dihydrolipoamide acetyltransferase)
MVFGVLTGLAAAGVERALMMPATDRLSGTLQRLLRSYGTPLPLEELQMRLSGTAADTTHAVELMCARGVDAIVVLGGDGTHRVVAKACGDIPLCALSTGTNNAFPELRESTVAGLATGLFAVGGLAHARVREPALAVIFDGSEPDLALVDVAVSPERFVGARALWKAAKVSEIVVAHANPGAVGLSAIAGMLAEEHTVLALDLPGHGGSSKAVGDGSVDSLADAVEQFLDSQSLSLAHLVGHSLGGSVAAAVAVRGRASSLTLVAPAGLAAGLNRDYIDGFIEAENRRELKPVLQMLFADESLVTRSLVDDVLKYKRIDGVDGALRTIAGAAFADVVDLTDLDVPALVIWGAEDRVVPAAHAERAPAGAEVHVIDGAGHSPHMEAAAEVNRLLERFLTARAAS